MNTDTDQLARECAEKCAYHGQYGCDVSIFTPIIIATFRPVVEERDRLRKDVERLKLAKHLNHTASGPEFGPFFTEIDHKEAETIITERDQLRAEVERLKTENEGLRAGRPIGAVVGAMTIAEQNRTITQLRAALSTAEGALNSGWRSLASTILAAQLKLGNEAEYAARLADKNPAVVEMQQALARIAAIKKP